MRFATAYSCVLTSMILGAPVVADVDEGLMGHYPLDGTATDVSGNSNHGTVYGCASIPDRDGNLDSALHFATDQDYISVDGMAVAGSSFTISAWIRIDHYEAYMRDFIRRGNHANYALGVRGDLTRFGYSASPPPNWGPNNIAGGTIGVSLDEWHLVVGVYDRDAGATRLYVDGVLDTEKTTAIDPYVPNSPLEIGNWYGTRNSWNYPTFSGDIDDVRLYGRALSSEEIGQLFTAGDGAVTFFTSVGPNPTGDNAWRASVDATIVEFDFEEFTNGAPIDVLQADDVAIDVDLCGLNGPAPAGQAMTASAFAYPGAVFGTALLNRPPGTSGAEDRSDIVFRFATPIVGAGAWMFDDQEPQLNQKRMVALDTAGNLHVSPILDNPGTGHMVEGFIGVTAGPDVELTAIAIQSLDGRGQLIPGAFEVDHLQVAIRTCPADLDGNGSVDFVDLTALLNKWGWCTACPADMNGTGDGWVGFDDLVMLLNAWGPC